MDKIYFVHGKSKCGSVFKGKFKAKNSEDAKEQALDYLSNYNLICDFDIIEMDNQDFELKQWNYSLEIEEKSFIGQFLDSLCLALSFLTVCLYFYFSTLLFTMKVESDYELHWFLSNIISVILILACCFAVLQIKDGYVKMLTWFFSKLNVNTDGWK